MLGVLFWVFLIATVGLAYRSKQRFDAYHRMDVTRTDLVNTIFMACLAAAGTVGTYVAKSVTHLP